MPILDPPHSGSTGTRSPAVELNHPVNTGFQSVYPGVLAPMGGHGAGSGDGQHVMIYTVVVTVVIVSVVFILSGFLHLFARWLGRRRRQLIALRQHSPQLVSALHGQLQHLFHLHDAGVEQAFINSLPVFAYGLIRGLKYSADCAVCLNEFLDDDRLRLLPKCKHAFHLDCIDTWLLFHSTCPLCRRSLLPDHQLASSSSHHHHGDLTETATTASNRIHSNHLPCPEDPQLTNSRSSSRITTSLHDNCEPLPSDRDAGNEIQEIHDSTQEIEELIEDETDDVHMQSTPSPVAPTIRVVDEHGTERVLKVELGKVVACRSVMSQSNSPKLTKKGARSYSMGSYAYIVDPTSCELTIAPTPYPGRAQDWSKPSHRSALSDGIPELASSPGNGELFWTSRGVYTPHSRSRARSALLTPIMSSNSSPFLDHSSYSPSQAAGDQWIDIDIARRDVIDTGLIDNIVTIPPQRPSPTTDHPSSSSSPQLEAVTQLSSDVSCRRRSSSLGRIELADGCELPKVSCSFRRSLSETVAMNSRMKDYVANAVDNLLSSTDENEMEWPVSRKLSLNWLVRRDKRIVFSAIPVAM